MATYVLIHGAGDSGWYWHLLEAELRDRGHDVVAPDLPSEDDAAGLSEYADVVVDAIGDRTDLVHFTEVAGRIVDPINAFFDQVFVMVDDADLRQARLGLLAAVRDLGAGVLDWPHLRLDLAAR